MSFQNGVSAGLSKTWNFVSNLTNRHTVGTLFFAALTAVNKNQWELSTNHHVIRGTSQGFDAVVFFMNMGLASLLVSSGAGHPADVTREMRRSGVEEYESSSAWEEFQETDDWGERFSIMASRSPYFMMMLIGAGRRILNPLVLYMINTNDDVLGIPHNAMSRVSWKTWYIFTELVVGMYEGYLALSLAHNMQAIYNRFYELEDATLPSFSDSNREALLSADEKPERAGANIPEFNSYFFYFWRFTLGASMSAWITTALINYWQVASSPSLVGSDDTSNGLLYFLQCTLAALVCAPFAYTAERMRHFILLHDKISVEPVEKAAVAGLWLGLLYAVTDAETLGLMDPSVELVGAGYGWEPVLRTLILFSTISFTAGAGYAAGYMFRGARAMRPEVLGAEIEADEYVAPDFMMVEPVELDDESGNLMERGR